MRRSLLDLPLARLRTPAAAAAAKVPRVQHRIQRALNRRRAHLRLPIFQVLGQQASGCRPTIVMVEVITVIGSSVLFVTASMPSGAHAPVDCVAAECDRHGHCHPLPSCCFPHCRCCRPLGMNAPPQSTSFISSSLGITVPHAALGQLWQWARWRRPCTAATILIPCVSLLHSLVPMSRRPRHLEFAPQHHWGHSGGAC